MPDTPRLNYAPRPPMHRRRVFQWWFYAVMLLGIAGSGYWWAPPAWHRAEVLYWQHRCMTYTPSANQIVFDFRSSVAVIPSEWSTFYAMVSPPGLSSGATIFMHEMKKPNGESRLVVIDLQNSIFESRSPSSKAAFTRVFVPGNLFQSPVELNVEQYNDGQHSVQVEPNRILAGTVDPSDPTHFTLQCVDEKNRATVYDGWLQNDDKLSFGPRSSGSK